ncbi:Oidioi.mRNA.OKI2018_I69.XSR.g14499.t2.cds [Oikopleura dioica]|uniref:Mediator of RNA polymerase II transcription subunit 28 n=1 Tax=Oikopleura dioica TaxID=34765 RepID=A0ABN7SDZ2_OIKDI|nr:Oidioi.mRNA.OKI2018_I69.XSR.g14499.t2.cds [Oikopleura dioica]
MNPQMNPNFNQGFNHQMNPQVRAAGARNPQMNFNQRPAHFPNIRTGFPSTGYPNTGFPAHNQQGFPGQPNNSMGYNPNQYHDPSQGMGNPQNMMNPAMQNQANQNQQAHMQGQQPQIQQMNSNQPQVSQAMSQPHRMSGNFEQSNMAAQNQNQMVNQQQVPTSVQNVQNQAPIPQPPPQEPSPPPNRPRNIFDELLESSEDIFARLIAKEEMIGCCDKDEIHVGVEHSVNKFIQKAQVVELFFNQRIAKQTRVCQQDVLMEEIKDLKAEIHRKQNWIEGIYAKAERWHDTTSFADNSKKPDVGKDGIHALESMSPASYRKK